MGVVILAALLAAAGPASGAEIVVTGEQWSDEAVSDFVRDIGEETAHGQLARWEEPVCPFVIGLAENHDLYIADAIASVAEAVGAEAADDDCDVNLVVVANTDPVALIEALRAARPGLFASIDPSARRRLTETDSPVRSWSVVGTRGADGRPIQRQGFSGGLGPAAVLGNPDTEYLSGVLPTRILRSTRIDLGATFILLDAARLEGLSLAQISAFVTMLALAQLDVRERIESDRSILNLFHDTETPPDDLTSWDVAYLRALYASDNRRSAAAQRGQMARLMRQYLAADDE